MRMLIAMIAAMVILGPANALAVASKISKERIYHKERHTGSVDQVLADVSYPWPFRRSQGGSGVMARELRDTGMIRTSEILFETNSADIKRSSRRVLNDVGKILSDNPDLRIEIGGHTDAVGSDSYNETLSKDRAMAVKTYLVSHFPRIKSGNLTVAGYGRSRPVASNETDAGRKQNRRVEFKVVGGAD